VVWNLLSHTTLCLTTIGMQITMTYSLSAFFDSRFFQNSLLHLAARGHVESVLPLVVQAYKRAKLFSTAMVIKNGSGWNPLHEAVRSCNFENTVFLFNECLENYPEAFEPTDNGELHVPA